MAINTPVQAEQYYLPFFISGKLDLAAIKNELRKTHKFSEEDVRITARILSNAHIRNTAENGNKISTYFTLVIGVLLLFLGTALTYTNCLLNCAI
jgi:hypothetical protein